MPTTMRYFREQCSDAREMNYGNTVLVRRDNDQWWLGYVQDIDSDQFFIDFDASTVSAEWIHAKDVCPHYFIGDLDRLPLPGLSAHVALRNEDNGPLVFQPATIMENLHCKFCAVHLGDSRDRRIVPVRQLTTQLQPAGSPPSFFGKHNGLVYRKHVVQFGKAHLLRHLKFFPQLMVEACQLEWATGNRHCSASCRFSILPHGMDRFYFHCWSGHSGQYEFGVRVFVRAATDTVTFICAEVHGDSAGYSAFWTVDSLKKACQTYLSQQQSLQRKLEPSTSAKFFAQIGGGFAAAGRKLFTSADSPKVPLQHESEMCITDLSATVLECVLGNTDVVTEFRASQVCALWRLVLPKSNSERCVMYVLRPVSIREPGDYHITAELSVNERYKFSAIMERSISPNTRAVALVDGRTFKKRSYDFQDDLFASRMQSIIELLEKKSLRVPLFIAKNFIENPARECAAFLSLGLNAQTGNYECRELSSERGWMSMCDELRLINYTVCDGVEFSSLGMQWQTGTPWPDTETAIVWKRQSDRGQLDVVIPFVRFRGTETAAEHCRGFIAAANNACPVVTPRVLKKVTAMQQRWVRTLAYPEEWAAIRNLFRMFNSFNADDRPQSWDQVDLRTLDMSRLSKLTFAALDAYYKD